MLAAHYGLGLTAPMNTEFVGSYNEREARVLKQVHDTLVDMDDYLHGENNIGAKEPKDFAMCDENSLTQVRVAYQVDPTLPKVLTVEWLRANRDGPSDPAAILWLASDSTNRGSQRNMVWDTHRPCRGNVRSSVYEEADKDLSKHLMMCKEFFDGEDRELESLQVPPYDYIGSYSGSQVIRLFHELVHLSSRDFSCKFTMLLSILTWIVSRHE